MNTITQKMIEGAAEQAVNSALTTGAIGNAIGGTNRAVAVVANGGIGAAQLLYNGLGVASIGTGLLLREVTNVLSAGVQLCGANFSRRLTGFLNPAALNTQSEGAVVEEATEPANNNGDTGSSEVDVSNGNAAQVAIIATDNWTGRFMNYLNDNIKALTTNGNNSRGNDQTLVTSGLIQRLAKDIESRKGIFRELSVAAVGEEALILAECMIVAALQEIQTLEGLFNRCTRVTPAN